MTEESQERFGEYLRKQREIRGFSLEEIAEQTKVSLRALKAIEAEDWEILPAEIYVRGFIRCYCETIGLDPHEALLRFEEAYRPYKQQKAENRYRDSQYMASKERSPLIWILLVIILLALLAGGYFFWYRRTPSPPTTIPTQSETLPSENKEISGASPELDKTPPASEETQEKP